MRKEQPARGLRNNNPLNIRRTKTVWKGMRATVADKAFCEFDTMAWGWRAAFCLLTRTYYHAHRLYSIRAIISRWAPPADHNDTEAYIRRVAAIMDYDPDTALGIPAQQPTRWIMLAYAMATVENGTTQFDVRELITGWEMARNDARAEDINKYSEKT